jgi:hypothetical protein
MLTSSSQIIFSVSVPMAYKLRKNIIKFHNQSAVIISENMLHFGIMMIMFILEVEVGVFFFFNTRPVAQPTILKSYLMKPFQLIAFGNRRSVDRPHYLTGC